MHLGLLIKQVYVRLWEHVLGISWHTSKQLYLFIISILLSCVLFVSKDLFKVFDFVTCH